MVDFLHRLGLSIGLLLFVSSISAQVVDNFSLDNLSNERLSLDEIKGTSLTIIDFWATWCKPCTKAMPKLNDLHHKYEQKGVSFIGISCDGPRSISQVGAVASSLKIDYEILKDINCEVMNTLQLQAFPTLIMLNTKNEIIYVHEGFASGDEKEIEEKILKYLK